MAYSEKVIDHYEKPRNVGTLDKNDTSVGTGLVGAPACGDVMKLQIKVSEDGIIEDAKFKTFGCGSAIASSSLITEWVKGKTIEEAGSIKNTQIAEELALPPVKIHCSVLCPYFVPTGITQSDRNRPQDLANTAPPTKSQLVSRAMSEKAVSSGKVTAEQVGQMTFDAIRNAGFYIYSHPHALAPVQHRFEDIVSQRNPSDPFEGKPDVRARLVDALRG